MTTAPRPNRRDDYTCELCGGAFTSGRSEEEAQAEALRLWDRRGDAPGMAVVCEDCFQELMAWLRTKEQVPS